jgi:hypothetical protein
MWHLRLFARCAEGWVIERVLLRTAPRPIIVPTIHRFAILPVKIVFLGSKAVTASHRRQDSTMGALWQPDHSCSRWCTMVNHRTGKDRWAGDGNGRLTVESGAITDGYRSLRFVRRWANMQHIASEWWTRSSRSAQRGLSRGWKLTSVMCGRLWTRHAWEEVSTVNYFNSMKNVFHMLLEAEILEIDVES